MPISLFSAPLVSRTLAMDSFFLHILALVLRVAQAYLLSTLEGSILLGQQVPLSLDWIGEAFELWAGTELRRLTRSNFEKPQRKSRSSLLEAKLKYNWMAPAAARTS